MSCQFSMGTASTSTYQQKNSAFYILDLMIEKLLTTATFPNMQKILLTGHGGGGDLIMRHALFSTYAHGDDVYPKLRYIPGNAIYFAYYDDNRPTAPNCGYDMVNS